MGERGRRKANRMDASDAMLDVDDFRSNVESESSLLSERQYDPPIPNRCPCIAPATRLKCTHLHTWSSTLVRTY